MKIGVVGCGTAGPAAAILLHRQGHDVTIFERVPDPLPVGAGVLIQPTGMTVLRRLGLHEEVATRASRINRLLGQTPAGRCVLNVKYADYDRWADRSDRPDPTHGMGVHRGILFETLLAAVRDAQITLHCGIEITNWQRGANDQICLIDSEGGHHEDFDLIIVTDGSRSTLRSVAEAAKLVKRSVEYRWGALWAIVPGTVPEYDDTLFQVYAGTKRLIGFLPTGPAIQADVPLTSVFWSIRLDQVPLWRQRSLDEWKREMVGLAPASESLLEFIQDHDQMAVAGYQDIQMKTWNTGRVVFLGDSGHAMSPQLGQGANFALFDAMVLADVMQQPEFESPGSVPQALDEYSRQRKAQLRYYQMASRWLTPFFQCSFTPLSWPRDWIFEPFSRIPFFKRQMVESLVGAKTGLFRTLPASQVIGYD